MGHAMQKIVMIALVAALAASYANVFAQPRLDAAKRQDALGQEQIEERGKTLHAAVRKIYEARKAGGALKSRNDILPEVQHYFPEPLSFDTAEKILRAAGLKVSRHADVPAHPALDFRDNVAGILVLDETFPQAVKFVMSLTPRTMGDYSVVGRMEADISISNL
jgi:hypothetical protein